MSYWTCLRKYCPSLLLTHARKRSPQQRRTSLVVGNGHVTGGGHVTRSLAVSTATPRRQHLLLDLIFSSV